MVRTLLFVCALNGIAQEKEKEKWDVEGDHGPSSVVEFETTEGTWMNVDISPDGRWIVFDLLGDIYRIPTEGGQAENLSSGVSFEHQPRFSPDGRTIAFVSDRDGADNIWLMNSDGSNRRQLTKDKTKLPTVPNWTPDGEYVVVKRHVTHTRSLGGGEIWLYHLKGGSGIQLTEKESFTSDQNEPAVSPDGRWVYYSHSGPFDYNRNVHGGIFQISRFDRHTGEIQPVTDSFGGAARPTPSPDGKMLAFVRRDRTKTGLFIRDLETGAERLAFDGLDRDQQETWTVHGVYPAFAWMRDSKQIVISFGGRIWLLEVEAGIPREIPFKATIKQKVADALHFEYPIKDEEFRARMVRWPTITPDGKSLIFQAVGHLWRMNLPNGIPERMTADVDRFEFAPAVSSDGRWITYVTWNSDEGGHIWKAELPKPGQHARPVRLTRVADQYANPAFSPRGDKIAFIRGSGIVNRAQDLGNELYLEVHWMNAAGGDLHLVTSTANRGSNRRMPRLRWNSDGSRILFQENEQDKDVNKTFLTSIKLDGTDERHLVENERAEEIVASPDGRWVAFKELHNIYVAPLPEAGKKAVKIEAKDAGVPVKQVTRYGGDWIDWSLDGRHVTYTLGPKVFRHSLDSIYAARKDNLEERGKKGGEVEVEEPKPNNIPPGDIFEIDLVIPKAQPTGVVALRGARLITMRGDEVIGDGTIVVEGPRIRAIGSSQEIEIPPGARVIDVKGKTIIPGIVDVHAHMGYSSLDINPDRDWQYYANLAYGVTTTHDPSASTQAVFAEKELEMAGLIVGPRINSTGFVLYGAENPNKAVIDSLDDARRHLRRLKAQGVSSVKSYNQLRRDARQWVIQAAREEEILVVPEGGSMLQQNLSMIIDGHTGTEHAIPVAPLKQDVVQLLARSGTGYTPTLIVGYGGIWGENYWYQHSNIWENERLLKFVPRRIIDARSRRRMMIPESEFYHFELSKTAKAIVDAGGRVQLGAHGQLQGLGAHWELWMFEQGGMSPMQALRCATRYGAEYIGMGKDIGSLERGKLADLVVLDKNPLEDIRNSESIHMVMKNGFLYNENLDEIWPSQRPRLPFRWEGQ